MINNTITKVLLVTIIYSSLAILSEYLFEPIFTLFTIRLALGFGLIVTLLYGSPAIIGVLLGEFLYCYLLHNSIIDIPISIALAIISAAYVYLASKLIQQLIKFPNHLTNALDWYKFFVVGGLFVSLIPSLLSVYLISTTEPTVQKYFWLFVAHWWIGLTLGILLVSPVLLCLIWKSEPIWRIRLPLFSIIQSFLIVILFISYSYVSTHEKEKLKTQIEQKSLSINSAIKIDISNYGEALYSIKSLFEYSPDISPKEFEIFSNKIKGRQPEIHSISYQPLVKLSDRFAYENMMKELYSENIQITERDNNGNFVRADERNEYTPITMRDIYDKDATILGFDTSSSNFSKVAREEAKKTNKVTISQAFKLASTKDESNKSVIFYLPLIDEGSFSGYVAMSIHAVKVIKSAIERVNLEGFSLKVWDGRSKFNDRIIFSINNMNSIGNTFGLSTTGHIKYISNDWQYELTHDPVHLHNLVSAQLLVITFSMLMIAIINVRLFEFTGKRYELRRRAQESEARFKGAFSNAAIGMVIVSIEQTILDANPSFCEMLGYEKNEIEGMSFQDITYHDDIKSNSQYHNDLISKIIDHYSIESRYVHIDGRIVWALLNVSLTCNDEGTPLYGVAQIQDITAQKAHAHKLNYLATYDSLTDLINRREFERRTERLLETNQHDRGEHALCFMDLDQFKVVNDTCGHVAGDELLRQLSLLLKDQVRHRDTLARLGGDEFGILMEHCSVEDSHRVATSILKAIQDYQFSWKGRSFKVGMSIGLVPITHETNKLTDLLKQADAACYMAKDLGRNRIHVYHADDSEIAQRQGEIQWVTRISHAIEEDRFCLYAQPIISLDNNKSEHYELLVRMIDEYGETIPPGAFLSAAERYNLIEKLDTWVVNKAFDLLIENQFFLNRIEFVSINLSGQSLTKQDFLEFIISKLESSGISGEKICFEITETAAISNLSTAMKFISTLKKKKCRFALDDFGSGLSSFGYLKTLSVDYLKIDGIFVKDIVDDPIDHAMVKSINEIGQVMGMQTIAEFVENDMIKGMLKEIGVNHVQGYGIGKPVKFDDIIKLKSI